MIGYEKFVNELITIEKTYPGLKIINDKDKIFLRGVLSVIDSEGKIWESFDVEIHCSNNFPYQFPILYEIGDKIPKIGDWHIYEDTGSCCVKILPEEQYRCRNEITVLEYINEEVMPYLFNQAHRRLEGYYLNGEYSHGALGLLQYYSQELKTGSDHVLTLKLLKYIATHDQPFRTSMCFCGKKNKFRHCHKSSFIKLKAMGNDFLQTQYSYMVKALSNLQNRRS